QPDVCLRIPLPQPLPGLGTDPIPRHVDISQIRQVQPGLDNRVGNGEAVCVESFEGGDLSDRLQVRICHLNVVQAEQLQLWKVVQFSKGSGRNFNAGQHQSVQRLVRRNCRKEFRPLLGRQRDMADVYASQPGDLLEAVQLRTGVQLE